MKFVKSFIVFTIVSIFAFSVQADVFNMGGIHNPTTGEWTGLASIEFVPVGNASNVADTVVMEDGTTGYGAVGYNYQLGKYEVTTAQYTAFLNAIASTDTYSLYNPQMANGYAACGIAQSGSSGSFTYSVTKNGNFPVNYVSWGDAARFCNWLQNGQPTGVQGSGTTETGAYSLDGTMSDAALLAVTRNTTAKYFIPSENEWHKAAYYKGGGTNASYWAYPTKNDMAPSITLPDPGNHANYFDNFGMENAEYTDPTNYLTAVGAFSASPGPYGTYDQGGNVWEWHETILYGSWRGLRGGSFHDFLYNLNSSTRVTYSTPSHEHGSTGFRVASIPEPSTIALLLTATIGGVLWWRQRT